MKKSIFLFIGIALLFGSCTNKVNVDSKIISNNNIQESNVDSSIMAHAIEDTLDYNKNVFISEDGKSVFVFTLDKNNRPKVEYKMTSEGESEETDVLATVILVFILALIFFRTG